MKYDFLIVGAGFAGAVLAERLAKHGKKILLVEKRNHLGGNCYDYLDSSGILVHKYGPHIFHTNSSEVWDYLSQFTNWHFYVHRVLANFNEEKITLPANLNTVYELFTKEQAESIEKKLIEHYGEGQKISIISLRKTEDADLKKLAEVVYEKVFLRYSIKQWGMPPEELDPQVVERVPFWVNRDNRYFKDKYQGVPQNGYTDIFRKMLDQPNVKVILGKDYKEIYKQIKFDQMIYTGPIDYFYDYRYGKLPYRSLRFEFETLNLERFQEVAVVNYTGKEPYTRITEFKHFTNGKNPKTVILREYPEEYQPGKNIPCYPIPRRENFEIFQRYKEEAEKRKDVIFVGRLAEYRYYNMDEVVGRALEIARLLGG